MSEKIEIDWEGYPEGLEKWMMKQKAPITIICFHGEIIWTLGDNHYIHHIETVTKRVQEESDDEGSD